MRNTTDYTRTVAANTRAALARCDKSQQWLAEATGIKEPTLHRRLRGLNPFYAHEIAFIAEALDIALEDLLPSSRERAA